MKKKLVLFDPERSRYWTGRWWEDHYRYTREIADAKTFETLEEIEDELNRDDESHEEILSIINETKVWEIKTIYIKQ